MNYIHAAIEVFKLGLEDTVYEPFVVLIIGRDSWDSLSSEEQNAFSKKCDSVVVIDKDNMKDQIARIYGIIREQLLTIVVDCPEEIERAVRDTSTGIYNYRLLL